MRYFLTLAITSLLFTSSFSQTTNGIFYCDVMANAFLPETRAKAANEFAKIFNEELSTPESFASSFEDYKWVSIKYPTDSTFRVITYQVELDGSYDQYGFVQMADGTLHKLKDSDTPLVDLEFAIGDKQDWYGALYYNLLEKGTGDDKHYLLFGFNGHTGAKHIKVVDILTFENGQPIFGKEVFNMLDNEVRPTLKSKTFMLYDHNANANCNYSELYDMIIYDNIIEVLGRSKAEGAMLVSDGSYKGFKWKNDQWQYQDRLSTRVLTEQEIYNNKKPATPRTSKDLFGKPAPDRN